MSSIENDSASAFKIRELTGDKRTLVLRGRALPYRPLSLEGTQRNSNDWYVGSPVSTLQVFGAEEKPTTINGMWKDIFIGEGGHDPYAILESGALDSDALATVQDLAKAVDDMRRKGQEVEVTWLHQARRGIMERFLQKWYTPQDLEWEITFQWNSQAEVLADIPMVDDNASDLLDVPNKVQGLVDGIVAGGADLASSAGERFATVFKTLNGFSDTLQDHTDALADSILQTINALSAPGDTLRQVAGILDGVKLDAEQFIDASDTQLDGLFLDLGALSSINTVERSFGEVLALRGTARDRRDQATNLRDLAAREQQKLIASADSTIISVFQARDGDDLRMVSQQSYGTPDGWRGLMVFNRLITSELAAGQIVFVPAQPPEAGC